MKTINSLLMAAAAVALLSGTAEAQAMPNVKQACMADKQRLCAGVASGRDMKACMKSHRSELSAGCSSAMQAARAARAERKAAAASAPQAAHQAGTAAPPPSPH